MPITNVHKKAFILFIVSLALLLLPLGSTLAEGKCASIDDLDDRAECYGDKIDGKQEEYESIGKKLDSLRNKKDSISNAISKYQSELGVTQVEISQLQNELNEISAELEIIRENLTDRKTKLAQKIDFRNKVIRNYSKRNIRSDLEMFFSVKQKNTNLSGFQYSSLSYMFRKSLTNEAVKLIHLLNSEIEDFEADKKTAEEIKQELETAQSDLLTLKADLDNKKLSAQNEFGDLKNKEEDYEEELFDLQSEISELSSKQQSILNQKYGTESGSVGEYEAPSAKTPDPPFKPAFAAFSYGAYTHYKGMSQYGAKGRADDGKSYKDILKFYYKEGVKDKDLDKICVDGYGNMDFQKYLYGIAEMPSTWPKDALKAQAIAARSYAYRYAKQGKCICTSQSCQVFLKSKSDNPPSKWKDAVDDTKGKILEGDVVAYYSSTTGGYIQNVGWDVKGSWPDDAYEKRAKSPWFRKAWYTKSYNDSSNCGRSHPWLTKEEMADILNSYRVWEKGSGSEKDRISPVTTSCWGGNPYSLGDMREKAAKYGKSYKEVKKISVEISNGGYTSQVKFETDNGTVSMDGQTFKTVFNLRAPSYIAIRSKIFDFEKED